MFLRGFAPPPSSLSVPMTVFMWSIGFISLVKIVGDMRGGEIFTNGIEPMLHITAVTVNMRTGGGGAKPLWYIEKGLNDQIPPN